MNKKIEVDEAQIKLLIEQNKDMKTIISDFFQVYTTIAPMIPMNENDVDLINVALKLPKIIRNLKTDPIFIRVFSKDYEHKLNKYAHTK